MIPDQVEDPLSTLSNPETTVAYDAAVDRVIVVFRDERGSAIIEATPDAVPALINGLMAARCEAKRAKRAAAPPPLPGPATCPPAARPPVPTPADHKRIRLQDRLERARR